MDARVVELVDSLASGASALYGRAGSTPASRTNPLDENPEGFSYFYTVITKKSLRKVQLFGGTFCLYLLFPPYGIFEISAVF